MATQNNPYLTFDGNCREAMTYYQKCFGGELTLQQVSETPIADRCPAGVQDHIMHSLLSNNGFVLMATDMQRPGEKFTHAGGMAIAVSFDEEKEINKCFSTLSEGGKVLDPLSESFWGALFGTVEDKFGKVWMLNYDKSRHS